jgi:restriction system protein
MKVERITVQFKMSENSLFAVLVRSSSWISFAIVIVISLVAYYLVPVQFKVAIFATAVPFVITGLIAAWKQAKVPGRARVEATVATLNAMSWRDFSALMEQAFQRDGFVVTRTTGAADLMLVKAGRTTLVSCKRWKAASHGLEPLRELKDLRRAQEAREAIYVCVGNLTDNARQFALDNKVTLMQGTELTQLLRLPRKSLKSAS